MSYIKLPKARGDLGIGYQTWNQLRDNLEEIRDDYLVEHLADNDASSTIEPVQIGGLGDGFTSASTLGRHSTPKIARSVATITWTGPTGYTSPEVTYRSNSRVGVVDHLDTGKFFIHAYGFATLRSFVQVLSDDAARYLVAEGFNSTATTTLGAGVLVYVYERNTNFDLVDGVPFSVTMYGTLT